MLYLTFIMKALKNNGRLLLLVKAINNSIPRPSTTTVNLQTRRHMPAGFLFSHMKMNMSYAIFGRNFDSWGIYFVFRCEYNYKQLQ